MMTTFIMVMPITILTTLKIMTIFIMHYTS